MRRRWVTAGWLALLSSAVGLALFQYLPSSGSQPETSLRVLVLGPHRLQAVDVDSGTITPVAKSGDISAVVAVGDFTVVQTTDHDRIFADAVVSYDASGVATRLGEADRVIPDPSGGLWLVINSSGTTDGDVALASVTGGSRSVVFSVPGNRQVVGASGDALVVLKGRTRDRRLQLWDPQLQEKVRAFGLATSVLDTTDRSILISRGCLNEGCEYFLVDSTSGAVSAVSPPAGWAASGPPALSPDGTEMAQAIVGNSGGTALAWGPPSGLNVDDTVHPAPGSAVFVSDGGWTYFSATDGAGVAVRGSVQLPVDFPRAGRVVDVS